MNGGLEIGWDSGTHLIDLSKWVMKVRFDGHLACEAFVYVDDGRITGFCREICWAAARKLASHCRFGTKEDRVLPYARSVGGDNVLDK